MNPKITPEIQTALEQHPVGPIRLEGEPGTAPVFLVRLDDIANLQEVVDERIREKLTEADADIEAGAISDWNAEQVKLRGKMNLESQSES